MNKLRTIITSRTTLIAALALALGVLLTLAFVAAALPVPAAASGWTKPRIIDAREHMFIFTWAMATDASGAHHIAREDRAFGAFLLGR